MVDSVLHDVGTLNPADIRGEEGFDIPSLLNVGLTAPYFHDGSAQSLQELLATGHPAPGTPATWLNEEEIAALVSFLRSIDATTAPVDLK
jgi:cytochrome c peroxidase